MTVINGIDPIVVDNIKIQTQKPRIIETQKTKVNDNQKNREGAEKEKRRSQAPQQNLIDAVEQLNKLLESFKVPLCLQIINNRGITKIQLIDVEHKRLITEMMPEKVFALLKKSNTTGFTLDELI